MLRIYLHQKTGLEEGSLKKAKQRVPALVDVLKPTANDLKKISDEFNIPLDTIKASIDKKEKPRLMELDNYSLIIFRFPSSEIVSSVAIFVSKKSKTVIVLRMEDSKSFNELIRTYAKGDGSLSMGTSHMVYRLLDSITEDFLDEIEKIEDLIDSVEQRALRANKNVVHEVFNIKKKLIYYHKSLLANRDVISHIEKEYASHIEKKLIKHFQKLYFDISQLIETTATQRELLSSTLEIYLSNLSNNLNISVRQLTAWGALILIPTLISGIYGMNFRYMPELQWRYGYLFSLGLMLFFVLLLLLWFKKKNWL